MEQFKLILLANSPGEISHWVNYIAKECKKSFKQSDITLFITPCQFASGNETTIARKNKNINKVYSPKESMKIVFTSFVRKKIKLGAILFLGGDPFYARCLGFKYNLPVYGYTEHKNFPKKGFKYVFYKHDIGDLMGDHILNFKKTKNEIYEKLKLEKKSYLTFLSGSRPEHFEHLIPLYSETIKEIKKTLDITPILSISSFIKPHLKEKVLAKHDLSNFIIKEVDTRKLIKISEFIITIPGTNTAEIAYMGTPFMVIIPLNEPKTLQFDGLFGLIGNLPILGVLIKKIIIKVLLSKKRYFSLPNMMKNREIVPEIIGKLDPKILANEIINQFNKEKQNHTIEHNLKEFKVKDSVSKKIIDYIIDEEH